jgi:F-type H+-transporting ATPase subunit delta
MVSSRNSNLLARRYAQAFLTVYGHELTVEVVDRMRELSRFLLRHNRILFFLTIPTIDGAVKQRGLTLLCERFELPASIKQLTGLLLESKRALLLGTVLRFIDSLYKKEHAILSFDISSAHPLSETNKEFFWQFLKKQLHKTIICTYRVDKSLIAGVRICSDTYLWEHSVAKQLRSVQLLAMH